MTTKKYSEGEVGRALREMDLEAYVYKPNDAIGPTQNWKPCDFMVWWAYDLSDSYVDNEGKPLARGSRQVLGAVQPTWIEVKSTPAQNVVNVKLWRPTQVEGMRAAARVGIPYLTVVHWPRRKAWTIGTAELVLRAVEHGVSIPFASFPIECGTGQLAAHLRAALLGEGL